MKPKAICRGMVAVALSASCVWATSGSGVKEKVAGTKGLGATGKTATHEESKAIRLTGDIECKSVSGICLGPDGNLLVCDDRAMVVKVVSPKGELVATWKPWQIPQKVSAHTDGTVFVAGGVKVAKLDKTGRPIKAEAIPASAFSRRSDVTGIAVTDKDVFVAMRGRTGYDVYRLSHDLAEPKKIVEKLRGCCGNLDLAAYGGHLYAAENSRHRIVKYDRTGKVLAKWGTRDRTGLEGFGGCCNPMNFCVGPGEEFYTVETVPDRVKRHAIDGKFLGLVGPFTGGRSCECVAIAVNADADRIYVADVHSKSIRILAKK